MLVFFNFIRTPRIFRSDYANNKAAVAQGVISNRPNSVAPRTARGTGRFVVLKLTELRRSVRSENKSVEGMRDSFGENTDEERDRISRQTGLRWSIARQSTTGNLERTNWTRVRVLTTAMTVKCTDRHACEKQHQHQCWNNGSKYTTRVYRHSLHSILIVRNIPLIIKGFLQFRLQTKEIIHDCAWDRSGLRFLSLFSVPRCPSTSPSSGKRQASGYPAGQF